jgi:phosphatidylinositol alpha-1,6-mannosyltransferase
MAGSADTRVPSILFVTAGFDLPGGIANLSGSVRDALEELRAAGRVRAVRTLSLHDARKPTAARRADATAAGGSRWRFIGTLLWRVMRSRPDLVLFDHVGPARAITLVPGRFRPRYGVMVHGVELEPPVRPSSRSVLIDASLVIANSVYTAQMAERLTDGEIRDRLHVVNPCVGRARVAAWHPHTAPSAAERTPVVLIAGRMEGDQPGKGHEALIAGWPSVVAAIGRARLVVAGDGDKRAKLERMAQDRGVSDSVEFSGYMSADELGSVYRNARVYAMPSRQEGFGILCGLHGRCSE